MLNKESNIKNESVLEEMTIDDFLIHCKKLKQEIAKVVIGQDDIVEQMLASFFASGHVLLSGVPGLAKTLMIKAMAQTLDLDFNRVQFVPDLMPSDIIGSEIIRDNHDTGEKEFIFRQGPVFTNIFMADEINRASPKTQAALLEVMQEHHVSIGGQRYKVGNPFGVFATQNPLEFEGTYPLPEAQLDRFLMSIELSYPKREDEIIISTSNGFGELDHCEKVMTPELIMLAQNTVREIPVPSQVSELAVDLVRASRPSLDGSSEKALQYIKWGAGPRAAQALIMCGRSFALLDGRYNVSISDIHKAYLPVMRHRVILNYKADVDNVTVDEVLLALADL